MTLAQRMIEANPSGSLVEAAVLAECILFAIAS
ncbi:hypothetical protein BH18ACT11_BH18ACT11_10900 [soil metagenome]